MNPYKVPFLLSIDQGTSGTKTVIFDKTGSVVEQETVPLSCSYPKEGFVEQSPQDILWSVESSLRACTERFFRKYPQGKIEACGISNQRETLLLWDKEGQPLCPAVVWQCKRSIPICEELKQRGLEEKIREKTGLVIDPYFSATKLIWLYRNDETVRSAIESGEACFGTVDTWLLYNLTDGEEYKTDHTNASRTLLFNIHSLGWDEELLHEFSLDKLNLPEVCPSASMFGLSDLFGTLPATVPIASMIGDSQAAAVGETVFHRGDVKATLGTGSSILLNIGNNAGNYVNGLVTTICFSLPDRVDYALEGIIVSCGSTINWIKNQLGIAGDEETLSSYAGSIERNNGVYLLPAFSGLGIPYWKMDAKAAIMGLTFNSGVAEISRAALESIGYQIKDALSAMEDNSGVSLHTIKFDGGIIKNTFVMQHISNLLEKKISTIGFPEVSALGAAYLCGLTLGFYHSPEELEVFHSSDSNFSPTEDKQKKNEVRSDYETWKMYIHRLL
ncbi:MAG: glycerol kinase GlpK [Spirochaetia bacterium]